MTASDFADTGQWRLLLSITEGGLEAYLENTLHPEIELQELCKVSWAKDKDKLCKHIEEAVYNHPRLLDDFATRIIIYDRRTLFIPTEIAEAAAGSEQELYQKIYKADTKDIMTDSEGDITAAWSLGPGVKSFLMRTFPGSRITCNLMDKVRRVKGRNPEVECREVGEGLRLYKEVRDGEVDLILMEGTQLLSASTHGWLRETDITNLEHRLIEAYRKL